MRLEARSLLELDPADPELLRLVSVRKGAAVCQKERRDRAGLTGEGER